MKVSHQIEMVSNDVRYIFDGICIVSKSWKVIRIVSYEIREVKSRSMKNINSLCMGARRREK